MSKRNQHIVRHSNGWAVRGSCSQRASSVHSTQREAINAGRRIAQSQKSELFVHGRDGKIRERDSYGNDPFPPKG